MKKAKRNNNKNIKVTNNNVANKGFIVCHDTKNIYIPEIIDAAIRNGNEDLLFDFFDVYAKHPDYSVSVLHLVFLG